MITLDKTHKDLVKMHFVAKARRRTTRDKPWLVPVHVSREVVRASDGHRVHWAHGVALPTGSYLVMLCTEQKIILAPTETHPCAPLIKATLNPPEGRFSALEWGHHTGQKEGKLHAGTAGFSLRRVWRETPDGPAVNLKYFMDLYPCNKIALWNGGESYYAANDNIGIGARLMGII